MIGNRGYDQSFKDIGLTITNLWVIYI